VSALPSDLPDVTHAILRALLERAEQPGRQRVARVRLSPDEHPAYFATDDVAPRRATNHVLQELAAAGILALHWQKWEQGNWLVAVDVVPGRADDLAVVLGRRTRGAQEAGLVQLLDAQPSRPGWHDDFVVWARAQLAAGRSVAPLSLEDPQLSADLLRLLGAVADGRLPMLERTLSVRLFGDSKRLEALRGGLVRVLRRHARDAQSFGDDDAALLRAYGLDRVPEYVPLAGPLTLQLPATDGHAPALVDLRTFLPSIALSAVTLRMAEIVACDARAVVTVENATSFSELLGVRPPDVLTVFTGGFASPAVIRLLQAIRARNSGIVLAHWGDLDAGGLRILAHLRTHLGDVAALAMDTQTLSTHRTYARPLTPGDRSALAALRELPLLADCAGLIERLLATATKLEQEAVDPGEALDHLSRL
jgi:hypothetical protein